MIKSFLNKKTKMSFVSLLSYTENWMQNFRMVHDQVETVITFLPYSRGVILLADNSEKKQTNLLKICLCIFLLSNDNLLAPSPRISFLFLLGFALRQSKFSLMFRETQRWEGVGITGGKLSSRWFFIS